MTPQADVLMGYVTGEARGQGHPFRDEESSIFQYCHKVPPCELEILSDLCLLTLASCSGNCVFTFATMNNELVCFLWKLEGLACRSLSLNTFFFVTCQGYHWSEISFVCFQTLYHNHIQTLIV